MISFREKSSTFSCQQCCAETQELGPQLCLVWRWGLQLALGTACRSGWLLGALEQAGSLYFFLLFGILRAVLHDWLCKKFQRSNIVPFAPLVFFFPLEDLFPVWGTVKGREIALELQLYWAELGTEGWNLFCYQDTGLPWEIKLFGLKATVTLALLISVSESKN